MSEEQELRFITLRPFASLNLSGEIEQVILNNSKQPLQKSLLKMNGKQTN